MIHTYIETDRLLLRDWKESDEEEFITMNKDTEVMRHFPHTLSSEESRDILSRVRKHFEDWEYGLFAVELKSTGDFIGFNGLSHPRFESDFTPCVEIGWRLKPKIWGQGLATEGAQAVINYAKSTLHLTEIYSFTALNNIASYRVMEKIGMTRLGSFKHPNLPEDDALAEHHLYKIEF